jgi:chemotaxis protein CheX
MVMQPLEQNKISEAVETVWSTMLGLQATTNPMIVGNRLKPSMLTGCIQITGAWTGAVTIECSGGLARRVASIMFGEDVCEITDDQINDALGELTNIVGGNIKALLPEPSHLSMPAVTEGTDYFFSVPGSRQMAQMSFSCEGKPFQVTILENIR